MVAALGDPTRRRVFFTVREAGELMGKDDVAEAVGITRRLAGFHLDKLVEQGFLRAEFQRRTGRTGPGAGRPAKLYALAESEEDSRLNVKHYDLLAELLLKAMSDRSGEDPQEVLERVGYEFGRELGEAERQAGVCHHHRRRHRRGGRAHALRVRRHGVRGGRVHGAHVPVRGDGQG